MLFVIYKDLCAHSASWSIRVKIVMASHSFHMIVLYRVANFFVRRVWLVGGLLGSIIEYFIRVVYSSDISCRAAIGHGLVIQHGMGIVIGRDVVIGVNCKLYNGVTLGNKDVFDPVNKVPHIGDNVTIGTGAKCLGGIKIGNNVVIGANSVVLNDIDDNCVAVGAPAHMVKKSMST